MIKPWTIFATHPPCLNKPLGSYISYNEAQGAAAVYRKIFGSQVAIRVVWDDQP